MKKIIKAIALLLCVCCLSFSAACGDVGSSDGSDKGNIPTQSMGENSSEDSGQSGSEGGSEENSGESGSDKEDSGVWTPPAKM